MSGLKGSKTLHYRVFMVKSLSCNKFVTNADDTLLRHKTCSRSLMDRTKASDAFNAGSIPVGCIRRIDEREIVQ